MSTASAKWDVFRVVISSFGAVLLLLASFALKWTFDTNAEVKAEKARNELQFKQILADIKELSEQSAIDTSQSEMLVKHWRLHNWARASINALEHNSGNLPSNWPDLSD